MLNRAKILWIVLALSGSWGSEQDSAEESDRSKASRELMVAESFYRREVSLKPQDADAWHGLSVVLRRKEDIDNAVLAIER
eukprot:767193-Hanusia_phi.AAC.8